MTRLVLSITFFCSVFFANWVVVVVLGLVTLAFFSAWEVILGAILMDLLYVSNFDLLEFPALWTVCSIVAYFAFHALRSRLF